MKEKLKNKYWIVAYCRSRSEKKIVTTFTMMGIENYCPLQKQRRRWSDRYKIIETPIFNGYVFFHVNENEKIILLQNKNILYLVKSGKQIVHISDSEMLKIKTFIEQFHTGIFSLKDRPDIGEYTMIEEGAFIGQTGIILKKEPHKYFIKINFFNSYLTCEIKEDNIIRIPRNSGPDQNVLLH